MRDLLLSDLAEPVAETVDSIILLAKGRDVSTLQMFHHAGAIACAPSYASLLR